MRSKNRKKFKNAYAKWSKKSPYKTLQLLECFARDLPIKDAARLTKMSERTVRDRYTELRGKLLQWARDYPDRFKGFGHLLLDPDGSINLHVLEVLFIYSESPAFKQRMEKRYPRFRTETDPALNHVIELAIRNFTATELPALKPDFLSFLREAFATSKSQTFLQSIGRNPPAQKLRLYLWKTTHANLATQNTYQPRRFPNAHGEALYRDLKFCLKSNPL